MNFTPLSTTNSDATNYNQVNNLAKDVQAMQEVQVFKDTTGNRRIIIGKLPDGTYGLVISKEGYDVVELLQGA